MPTVFYYCPSCNYKALQIKIVADTDGVVQSYDCQCLICGYCYASDGRESGGRGTYKVAGDNPARYPEDPTPETVDAWACQQEAEGILVSLATCFDGKGNVVFVRGEPPDWVGRRPRDFEYFLRRAALLDGEYVPCRLDDPQRTGWAIFTLGTDGSLKRVLFSNDLFAVTSAFDPPTE